MASSLAGVSFPLFPSLALTETNEERKTLGEAVVREGEGGCFQGRKRERERERAGSELLLDFERQCE